MPDMHGAQRDFIYRCAKQEITYKYVYLSLLVPQREIITHEYNKQFELGWKSTGSYL